ncbi:MAG: hypothetical protein R3195_08180 [Gemmatimonadota bacterium]|nr:hypothetical protein [Gemmatimonadota bacterium]
MSETAGYRALTSGAALLGSRRVIFDIAGPRATRMVNGLVTNSLEPLESGRAVYALALTAKGRPLAEMRLLPPPDDAGDPGAERVWVDVAADTAEAFRDLLRRSIPPIFATVEEIGVERVSLVGPGALETAGRILERAGIELPPAGVPGPLETLHVKLGEQQVLIVGREPIEVPGLDTYLPAAGASDVMDALKAGLADAGGSVADPADWEIVRVESGLPVFGKEITADNLPQETGQTARAVSFDKGCYTGQEVVARIHYRGHVNRVLRGVRFAPGTDDVGPGTLSADTRLFSGGREVGRVVTAVDSPRLGRIGLAYVRTSAGPGVGLETAPDGTTVIEVVELPFTVS